VMDLIAVETGDKMDKFFKAIFAGNDFDQCASFKNLFVSVILSVSTFPVSSQYSNN
jgi:hypothetical protein